MAESSSLPGSSECGRNGWNPFFVARIGTIVGVGAAELLRLRHCTGEEMERSSGIVESDASCVWGDNIAQEPGSSEQLFRQPAGTGQRAPAAAASLARQPREPKPGKLVRGERMTRRRNRPPSARLSLFLAVVCFDDDDDDDDTEDDDDNATIYLTRLPTPSRRSSTFPVSL
jgi:hypothetical protein